MQVFFRSLLAVAFFGMILLAQPTEAEVSDDFNNVDLYFYGDLDMVMEIYLHSDPPQIQIHRVIALKTAID